MGLNEYKDQDLLDNWGGISDIESGAIDGGMDDLINFVETSRSYLCACRSGDISEDDGINGEVGDSEVPDMQRR